MKHLKDLKILKIFKSFLHCYFDSPETDKVFIKLTNNTEVDFSRYHFFFTQIILLKKKKKKGSECTKFLIETFSKKFNFKPT